MNNKIAKLIATNNNRLPYIDVARGIAIILMIIGHVISHGWKRAFIFSFHMPLFIIISGYFYRDKPPRKIISSVKRLLLPTAIIILVVQLIQLSQIMDFWNALAQTTLTIITGWSYQKRIIYEFPGAFVVWFVYMLVIIQLLFALNKRICKKEITLGLLVITETFIGFVLGIKGFYLPWSMDIAMASMIFYYIGYILKKYKILEKLISSWQALMLMSIIWVIGIKYDWIELAIRRYPNGLWCFLVAICGSLIIIKVSHLLWQETKILSSLLSKCGQYSMLILFGHYIESKTINYKLIFGEFAENHFVLSIMKIFFSIIIAYGIFHIMKIFHKLISKVKSNKLK